VSEPPAADGTDGTLARLEEQVTALRSEVRRLGAVGTLPATLPSEDAATAAAIAELDAVAIAGVMIGAWVIVALIEWAASRAERRPEATVYVPQPALPPASDPAWFSPPVEQTLLDAGADDNVTEVTRLPPVEDEIEATAERKV
jgi:hypothetical protein